MRIGAAFPTLEIGGEPTAIRDWAQAVEALGYDHILSFDHILGFRDDPPDSFFGPLGVEASMDESLVLFGFLAALTRRVELVTGVLVSPVRQTALLAKQAAEVDVLTGGRLRLGLGIGWVPRESAALHEDYATRAPRVEEQIAVMRALWTEDAVSFHGQWHDLSGAGIAPRPVQRPIPIWLGGNAVKSLERAARLADGWMPVFTSPDVEARSMIEMFRREIARAGRTPASVGLEVFLSMPGVRADQWHDDAAGWRELGVTHLTVSTLNAGLATVQAHIDALERIRSAIAD